MAKFSLTVLVSALVASTASAFVAKHHHQASSMAATALMSSRSAPPAEGEMWDPMGLYEMGSGKAFDTFPNMFPHTQYLDDSELKHGRMSMLAWTGVWATSDKSLGLNLHFDGFPVEPDWTKALPVFMMEQPVWFGAILACIMIAEGESVGHSGDNFRGKSSKREPGDLNFDYLGIKKKASEAKMDRYRDVERKNGRAAMMAMASLFSYEAIPGSVPIMDIIGN